MPLIVVIGWLVSLGVALFIVPKLAAKRAMENFGLIQVDQGGKRLFVPVGPDGEPVKVPIGTKEKEDGSVEIIMGYSTLPITLIHMVASETAKTVGYHIMSAKGHLGKALKNAATAEELKEAGLSAAEMLIIDQLPAKAKAVYLGIKQLIKQQGTPQGGQQQTYQRRGGGPI